MVSMVSNYGRGEEPYSIWFLNCGNADAAFIKYWPRWSERYLNILVDAGTSKTGEQIFETFKFKGKLDIDYAYLSHPHDDHLGGFLSLLDNPRVSIKNFLYLNPYLLLDSAFKAYGNPDLSARQRWWLDRLKRDNFAFFATPSLGNDLLKALESCGTHIWTFCAPGQGISSVRWPLNIVGPNVWEYMRLMLEQFEGGDSGTDTQSSEPLTPQAIWEKYRPVVDTCEDDSSPENLSSLILSFTPLLGERFLFTGDAPTVMLRQVARYHASELERCVLKVPHHGSKHDIDTEVLNSLKPSCAVISAKGPIDDHPNVGVLNALEKHCDVYATYSCGEKNFKGLHFDNGNPGPINPPEPLRTYKPERTPFNWIKS